MIINYYRATNSTDKPQRVQHPTLRKFMQVRRLPSELSTTDGGTLPIKNGVVIVPPGVTVAFPGPVYNTCIKNSSRFVAHGKEAPGANVKSDFFCDVCGKECASAIGLTSHMRSHAPKPTPEEKAAAKAAKAEHKAAKLAAKAAKVAAASVTKDDASE